MKILVTGGGTGGHIYPALSFVDYVKEIDPTAEFLYIGATRGLENKIVPPTGIPFKTLEIQGFKRKFHEKLLRSQKNHQGVSTGCGDRHRRLRFWRGGLCCSEVENSYNYS